MKKKRNSRTNRQIKRSRGKIVQRSKPTFITKIVRFFFVLILKAAKLSYKILAKIFSLLQPYSTVLSAALLSFLGFFLGGAILSNKKIFLISGSDTLIKSETNLFGSVGVKIADEISSLFGAATIFVPVVILFLAVYVAKKTKLRQLFVQVIAGALFCTFLPVLFELTNRLGQKIFPVLAGGTGGKIGRWMVSFLETKIEPFWIAVVAVTVVILATAILLRINLIRITMQAAFYVAKLFYSIVSNLFYLVYLPFVNLYELATGKSSFAEDYSYDCDKPVTKLAQKVVFFSRDSYTSPQKILSVVSKIFDAEPVDQQNKIVESEAKEQAARLEEKLSKFGIRGSVQKIEFGPVVTLFEYRPEIDSKISKIVSLEDDLAMALSAVSIRTVAPIPGKNAVGFEIANRKRKIVKISEALMSNTFLDSAKLLPIILGTDTRGKIIVSDLSQMPHLLVAGSTGTGKSVCLNSIIVGLTCRLSPEELRLILIDPKRLEFSIYENIPHLLFPVVNDATQSPEALGWVIEEMERRYLILSKQNVRNIIEYRELAKKKDLEQLPFITVVIDELADLMMVGGREIETQIARIAQMSRAAGIHLIVATQRPSVDVITGLIKINFPTRISFRVSSKVDSRTILDSTGAEKLLGRGDMLYMDPTNPTPLRIHGTYVSNEEVQEFASYLRKTGKPQFVSDLSSKSTKGKTGELKDKIYDEVVSFVKTRDEVSISLLQRKFRIGFNRSARIIEQLESDGIVSAAGSGKMRKVLRE